MRAEIDAVELDRLRDDYATALKTRKDLPSAVPSRFREGFKTEHLTSWIVSREGSRRIKDALKALAVERRALAALEKFAAMQVTTAPACAPRAQQNV